MAPSWSLEAPLQGTPPLGWGERWAYVCLCGFALHVCCSLPPTLTAMGGTRLSLPTGPGELVLFTRKCGLDLPAPVSWGGDQADVRGAQPAPHGSQPSPWETICLWGLEPFGAGLTSHHLSSPLSHPGGPASLTHSTGPSRASSGHSAVQNPRPLPMAGPSCRGRKMGSLSPAWATSDLASPCRKIRNKKGWGYSSAQRP